VACITEKEKRKAIKDTGMKTQDDMSNMFDNLTELSAHQRATIKHRYRFLMDEYRSRARKYSFLFYVMRSTMTVGSLAVPALLSLQNTENQNLYWFTWGLSLAVTTANGIMTLFKLESKFLALHTTMEQLRTETWQYLELAGHYSGHHGHVKPTHANQYVFYCSRIEKIRMKQVGEEYVKHTETEQGHAPGVSQQTPSTLAVPSPADQAIGRESVRILGDDTVIELKDNTEERPTVSLSSEGKTLPPTSP